MALFPRNFYNSANDTSFTPLFRLLDDFDNYSREFGAPAGGRRHGLPTWQPKFDIRETGDAYELHGELPGIVKENVNIEFVEPQAMTIRGKIERTYSVGPPPAGRLQDTTIGGVITEDSDSNSRKSRQPTSEDDNTTVTKQGDKGVDKSVDNAKYWLTERSMGEFSRTFNFPVRVDQDAVTANLKDGILNVLVPKAKKHENHRRIAVH